jgi:hypothetical protein
MKIQTKVFLVLAAVASGAATANTIHVCSTCAHTTIQTAVNDAASGDTIAIGAGRYSENITVEGKQLILQGAAGGTDGVSEVNGAARGPVFTLGSGVTGDTPHLIEIHNLTISQGNHTSGTGQGGGVQVRAGAYLHLYNSTVTQNYALSAAGVSVNTPGAPVTLISGCIIDSNQTPISVRSHNYVGGGVGVFGGSSVSVQASTITHNLSNDGGGLYADVGTQLTVDGSTFSENAAQPSDGPYGQGGGGGGGLESYGGFTISNSSFVDNLGTGPNGGGGLFFVMTAGDTHVISNTIVARNNNVAGSLSGTIEGPGGGIAAVGQNTANPSTMTLISSFIVQNLAEGGLWYDRSSTSVSLNNTVVLGNSGGQVCDNQSPCTP